MQHIYELLAASQEPLTGAQIYRHIAGEVETADLPAPSTLYRWLGQLPDHCRVSDGKFCLTSFAQPALVSEVITRAAGDDALRLTEDKLTRALWLSPRTNVKFLLDWAALDGAFSWKWSPYGGLTVQTLKARAG